MAIRISESGKLLLVESGIQEFFSWNPESFALEFNYWNPKSMTWNSERNPQRGRQTPRLVMYFCLITSIQQCFAASGNCIVQGSNAGQAFFMAIFMWLVRTTANMMDTRIKYQCIYRKGKK